MQVSYNTPNVGSFVVNSSPSPPSFDDNFKSGLLELLKWRGNVRHFRPDPIPSAIVDALIASGSRSPSVGYSQPWRFVLIKTPAIRKKVRESLMASLQAPAGEPGERSASYADLPMPALPACELNLWGLDQAPEQMAVFCDMSTNTGHGLGRQTMPTMLEYSTVMACYTLWLVARSYQIGVGWMPTPAPDEMRSILLVPDSWKPIAYLCIGYPAEDHLSELANNACGPYQAPEILVR